MFWFLCALCVIAVIKGLSRITIIFNKSTGNSSTLARFITLTTRRSYKKALAPFDALTVMGKEMKDEFDMEILGEFIKFTGPDL